MAEQGAAPAASGSTGIAPGERPDLSRARTSSRVAFVTGTVVMVSWWSDSQDGLLLEWEYYALPALTATLLIVGTLLLIYPRRTDGIVLGALLPSSAYLLGTFYMGLNAHGPAVIYSMASNSLFMPLLYMAAFVALPRGAVALSWSHYAGMLVIALWSYWQSRGLPLRPEQRVAQHLGWTALMAHSIYVIALSYISQLRFKLSRAERDAYLSKEQFLAMLSHEIRSPLQAMLGSIELLAIKVKGVAETRAVDRLRRYAMQLDTHLRDITEFTRLESPLMHIHVGEFDLCRLVREVYEEQLAPAQAQGLTLEMFIAPEAEPALRSVQSDANRVRQILSNLLSNAIKYTQEGGVTVTVMLSIEHPGCFKLTVEDTGIGIPPESLGLIFEPFVRLESEQRLSVEGSGLGLAVVKRLVDRMHGFVDVSSQAGVGARFEVTLPLRAAPRGN